MPLWYRRYGSVFRTMMLGSRIWVVTDLDALRGPLRDEGAYLEIPFKAFQRLVSAESFLNRPGVHGPWRKIFSATLAPPRLAAMVPKIAQLMQSHLSKWEEQGQVTIFRAARVMGVDLAVDVILDIKLLDGTDRAWVKSQVEDYLDGLYGLPLNLPGSTLSKALAARARLVEVFLRQPDVAAMQAQFVQEWEAIGKSPQAYAAAVLDQHTSTGDKPAGVAAEEEPSGKAAGAPTPAAPGSRPAVLPPSIMTAQLMGRAMLKPSELADGAMSLLHMLVASADTTRFALFNTWTLLAMSPRVQDKLYEEQKKVMAEYGEELSYAATCHMPYMDATLKECMRLLPASAGGIRKLTADMQVGGYTVPAGEYVWYHAGLMHYIDPVLWDGDTSVDVPAHMDWRNNFEGAFRPERWLSEETRPRYMFTFGTGAHLCIGMNLVYLEVKLLLSMVLRKYRLRLHTPDMLLRCERLFPFFLPAKGTDTVLLEPR
ncbi:hypothetical protein CHLRE_10g427350v5 [Chlamydomonas reinhardtii]|uniref:Cytochrome P450, CYP85 clan n=1 Tax=Chlamydomonas reinhardtii TaxID=3055 RepID=A0A2K3D9K6_CHLRE|nr:uncharacterized protein CHLRE_10g427350v5 [Chlamydomonas reinhardtii]PNW77221.1 hypothetical protein CHLRE_10g427350v5 [Chlamydomonas reinhardtii]